MVIEVHTIIYLYLIESMNGLEEDNLHKRIKKRVIDYKDNSFFI